MHRIIIQFVGLLLFGSFLVLVLTALVAALSTNRVAAQQQQRVIDKARCKQRPTDPRCKDV